ncbi:Secreted beta-glucosidase sun1 [Marasmius tenuissimus]|uniref:Secreted beta-glucosidase sun1 n=1 Tax=Marasmius tenuissimus TaxID=585030 RepID=A0ABR3AF92_9AGAR
MPTLGKGTIYALEDRHERLPRYPRVERSSKRKAQQFPREFRVKDMKALQRRSSPLGKAAILLSTTVAVLTVCFLTSGGSIVRLATNPNSSFASICEAQTIICSFSSAVWKIYCPTMSCELLEPLWWDKFLMRKPQTSESQRSESVRRDFALATNGGEIVSRLTSITLGYSRMSVPELFVYRLRGYTLKHAQVVPPTIVIGNEIRTGECWAFDGSHGHIGFRLPHEIQMTHITIHYPLPEELSPEQSSQAPTSMTVWSLIAPGDIRAPHLYSASVETFMVPEKGPFHDPNLEGRVFVPTATLQYEFARGPKQTFPLETTVTSSLVILEVRDNAGGHQTCLYKVSIHGRTLQQRLS